MAKRSPQAKKEKEIFMADATPVPILSLDSLVNRPVVIIDGKEYQLITQAILPPIDVHRLAKYSRRIDVLTQQEELTADEERELEALPDRMCRLILDAPDDVQQKLPPKQRMEIIATFLTAPWLMTAPPRAEETAPPTSSPIGAN